MALAEPDADGDAEVLAVALPEVLDVVVPDVDVPDVDVEEAGDCGPW